jgi:hypothetical protein
VSRLPAKLKPGSEPLDTQELRDWRAALPRGGSLEHDRLGNALRANAIEGQERAKREIDWSACPLYAMHPPGIRPGLWANSVTRRQKESAAKKGMTLEEYVAYVASLSMDGRTRRRGFGKRPPSAPPASVAKDPE